MLLVLGLAFLLAGCGQVMVSGQEMTGTPTVPAATATPAKITGRTSADCPLLQAPADAGSFQPDVIVSQDPQNAGIAQPITLTQGQRLEIRLQPGYAWELTVSDLNHVLSVPSPGGWYDGTAKACIWHFAAAGKGNAHLSFQGDIVCPPLELCPSSEQSAVYSVTIQ
jgi:hypothetical protein